MSDKGLDARLFKLFTSLSARNDLPNHSPGGSDYLLELDNPETEGKI